MNPNNEEYHFYDVDENFEDKGLLAESPDDMYENEEPKKAQTAFLAAALGALLLLIMATLAWVLFHKRYGNLLMSHAIMATLALLFIVFAVLWAMGVKKSIGMKANPLMTLIVYLGSLIFACYFIGCALYLWIYRSFYLNYARASKGIPDRWDKHFWDYDYDYAVKEDWRILLTIVIFCVIVAICFGLIAWAAYTFLSNRVQTNKITLMCALIAVTVFAFLVLIWYQDNKYGWKQIQKHFRSFGNLNILKFFFILSIIAISCAFVNAVMNFIGTRQGSATGKSYNFIWGWIWLILAFVTLITMAIFFRDIYKFSHEQPLPCQDAADLAHEDHYDGWSGFCNGKYLERGQSCRKSDLYHRWETQPSELRSLNPVCCVVSNDVVVWPFYLMGIWLIFLALAMAVSSASNFGLAEFSKEYDDYYKTVSIIDLITIIVILLIAIALGLYLIFRPSRDLNTKNGAGINGFNTLDDGTLEPKESYQPIDQNISKRSQLPNGCYYFSDEKLPPITVDPASCNSLNCGVSAGLMVTNGEFKTEQISGGAKIGSNNSRQYFFPNSNNLSDGFLHIYGTQDEVNRSLSNVVVCNQTPLKDSGVFMNAFQADLNKINENSLTQGNSPVFTQPTVNGTHPNLSSYSNVTKCEKNCKAVLLKNTSQKFNIIGYLKVKDSSGNFVPYGIPETDVTLSLSRQFEGKRQQLGFGAYDANGLFKIVTPTLKYSDYIATIDVKDKSGNYLNNSVDVNVTYPGPGKELNVGDIFLTTQSGNGCKNVSDLTAQQNCFANQAKKNHDLKINIYDIVDSELKQPLDIKVFNSHSSQGTVIADESVVGTDHSISLPAGYYKVQISGANYVTKNTNVILDSAKSVDVYLEKKSDSFKIYINVDNTTDKDYDLNLKMVTQSGETCIVNPLNKSCPYARHVKDVVKGEKGYEMIEVDKFVNANYMVFVSEENSYSGTCAAINEIPKRKLKHNQEEEGKPKRILFINKLAQLFEVYTTGGSGGSSEHTGLSATSDTKLTQNFKPIKVGDENIISHIFQGLKSKLFTDDTGKEKQNKPNFQQLFNIIVSDKDEAQEFVELTPMLYNQSEIQNAKEQGGGDSSSSFNDVVVDAFKSLEQNQYQVDETLIQKETNKQILDEIEDQKNLIKQDNKVNDDSLYDDNKYDEMINFLNGDSSYEEQVELQQPLEQAEQMKESLLAPIQNQQQQQVVNNQQKEEVPLQRQEQIPDQTFSEGQLDKQLLLQQQTQGQQAVEDGQEQFPFEQQQNNIGQQTVQEGQEQFPFEKQQEILLPEDEEEEVVIEEEPEVEKIVEEEPEQVVEEIAEEESEEEEVEQIVEEEPEQVVEEIVEEVPEQVVEEIVEEVPEQVVEEIVEEEPEQVVEVEEIFEDEPEQEVVENNDDLIEEIMNSNSNQDKQMNELQPGTMIEEEEPEQDEQMNELQSGTMIEEEEPEQVDIESFEQPEKTMIEGQPEQVDIEGLEQLEQTTVEGEPEQINFEGLEQTEQTFDDEEEPEEVIIDSQELEPELIEQQPEQVQQQQSQQLLIPEQQNETSLQQQQEEQQKLSEDESEIISFANEDQNQTEEGINIEQNEPISEQQTVIPLQQQQDQQQSFVIPLPQPIDQPEQDPMQQSDEPFVPEQQQQINYPIDQIMEQNGEEMEQQSEGVDQQMEVEGKPMDDMADELVDQQQENQMIEESGDETESLMEQLGEKMDEEEQNEDLVILPEQQQMQQQGKEMDDEEEIEEVEFVPEQYQIQQQVQEMDEVEDVKNVEQQMNQQGQEMDDEEVVEVLPEQQDMKQQGQEMDEEDVEIQPEQQMKQQGQKMDEEEEVEEVEFVPEQIEMKQPGQEMDEDDLIEEQQPVEQVGEQVSQQSVEILPEQKQQQAQQPVKQQEHQVLDIPLVNEMPEVSDAYLYPEGEQVPNQQSSQSEQQQVEQTVDQEQVAQQSEQQTQNQQQVEQSSGQFSTLQTPVDQEQVAQQSEQQTQSQQQVEQSSGQFSTLQTPVDQQQQEQVTQQTSNQQSLDQQQQVSQNALTQQQASQQSLDQQQVSQQSVDQQQQVSQNALTQQQVSQQSLEQQQQVSQNALSQQQVSQQSLDQQQQVSQNALTQQQVSQQSLDQQQVSQQSVDQQQVSQQSLEQQQVSQNALTQQQVSQQQQVEQQQVSQNALTQQQVSQQQQVEQQQVSQQQVEQQQVSQNALTQQQVSQQQVEQQQVSQNALTQQQVSQQSLEQQQQVSQNTLTQQQVSQQSLEQQQQVSQNALTQQQVSLQPSEQQQVSQNALSQQQVSQQSVDQQQQVNQNALSQQQVSQQSLEQQQQLSQNALTQQQVSQQQVEQQQVSQNALTQQQVSQQSLEQQQVSQNALTQQQVSQQQVEQQQVSQNALTQQQVNQQSLEQQQQVSQNALTQQQVSQQSLEQQQVSQNALTQQQVSQQQVEQQAVDQSNQTTEGEDIGEEVLPLRRLHRGRLLAASDKFYIQFCFTGFGQQSIKKHLKTVTSDPDMKECSDLYPKEDPYSLENLQRYVSQ